MNTLFQVFAILTTIALLLPVFSGYVLAFAALNFQLTPWWRRRLRSGEPLARPLALWSWPIAILLGLLSLATVLSLLAAPAADYKEGIRFWGNNVVKYGLLWFFMRNFLSLAVHRWRFAEHVARIVAPILVIHFIYCLAQRYWGIDWAHGWNAVLPSNRYAYGVYRVSGFSSHPLTLGYQLCLVLVLSASLATQKTFTAQSRRSAGVAATFALLTLLISGSRGPLAVGLASLGVLFWRRLSLKQWLLVAAASAAVVVCAGYLGLLNRFVEVLNPNTADSRTMDWRVYGTAFIEQPFSGLGPAGFRQAISAYYSRFGGDANIGLAHNFFLQVAAETGLIGLAAYAAWFGAWVRFGLKCANSHDRDAIWAVVCVMVLSALTQNSWRDSGVVYALTIVTMILVNLFVRVEPKVEV